MLLGQPSILEVKRTLQRLEVDSSGPIKRLHRILLVGCMTCDFQDLRDIALTTLARVAICERVLSVSELREKSCGGTPRSTKRGLE